MLNKIIAGSILAITGYFALIAKPSTPAAQAVINSVVAVPLTTVQSWNWLVFNAPTLNVPSGVNMIFRVTGISADGQTLTGTLLGYANPQPGTTTYTAIPNIGSLGATSFPRAQVVQLLPNG